MLVTNCRASLQVLLCLVIHSHAKHRLVIAATPADVRGGEEERSCPGLVDMLGPGYVLRTREIAPCGRRVATTDCLRRNFMIGDVCLLGDFSGWWRLADTCGFYRRPYRAQHCAQKCACRYPDWFTGTESAVLLSCFLTAWHLAAANKRQTERHCVGGRRAQGQSQPQKVVDLPPSRPHLASNHCRPT